MGNQFTGCYRSGRLGFIFGLALNLSVSFGSCMSSVTLGKHVGIMLCDFLYNGKIRLED